MQVATEDPDDGRHGVFFNRGVVASRAYEERFGTQAPSKVPNDEAYKWLSRGLEEAIVGFIGQAVDKRYALRAAMYEFDFEPVLSALKVASDAGADVQIVVHEVAKKGDNTPQRNLAAIAKPGIAALCRPRTKTTIAHNKFIVLLRDGKPEQVWTGSTNVTEGGIFGHANVGHRISDRKVAQRYLDYWQRSPTTRRRKALKAFNDPTPMFPKGRPHASATTVFSSRTQAGRRSSGTAGSRTPRRARSSSPPRSGSRPRSRRSSRASGSTCATCSRPRDRQRRDRAPRPVEPGRRRRVQRQGRLAHVDR